MGRIIETAVGRQDAVDDVLKTIFEKLLEQFADAAGDGGSDLEAKKEEAIDKRLFVFRRGVELVQREGNSGRPIVIVGCLRMGYSLE